MIMTVLMTVVRMKLSVIMVTWVPGELFHVPEAHNEQENVVGEPLLYVCTKHNTSILD